MDIQNLLAGGFIGTIITQIMLIINSNITFNREKQKMFYQNKLAKGEALLGLYAGIYYNSITIISVFEKCVDMMNDIDIDLDYDALNLMLKNATDKVIEFENKIMTEGASAYLYYNIKIDWTEVQFQELFELMATMKPKVDLYQAYVNNNDEVNPLAIQLKDVIIEDLNTLILNLKGYRKGVDSIIDQLQIQSKK